MLTLTVKNKISLVTNVYQLRPNDIVEIDGFKFVKWNVPSYLLANKDKLEISARIRTNIKNVLLKPFELIVYETTSSGMEAILTTIRSFNYMYSLYLDSVKRSEINRPNGVVGLDSNGKFDEDYLPSMLREHITNRLYDTLNTINDIHGLKIDRVDYNLLYYDNDDDEWYVANSIFGGRFGHPNKSSPEYDVFGGYFTDEKSNIVDSSLFTVDLPNIVDASTFDNPIEDSYDGGLFTDVIPPSTGGGFNDKADPITGGGF